MAPSRRALGARARQQHPLDDARHAPAALHHNASYLSGRAQAPVHDGGPRWDLREKSRVHGGVSRRRDGCRARDPLAYLQPVRGVGGTAQRHSGRRERPQRARRASPRSAGRPDHGRADATVEEAHPSCPRSNRSVVKRSITRFAAESLHPTRACELIRQGRCAFAHWGDVFSVPSYRAAGNARGHLFSPPTWPRCLRGSEASSGRAARTVQASDEDRCGSTVRSSRSSHSPDRSLNADQPVKIASGSSALTMY